MLKAGWSVAALILAALGVALLVLANIDVNGNKAIPELLQNQNQLETRLHRDLRVNGAVRKTQRSGSNSKKMMQEAFIEMGKDNKMLRHEVEDLQQQSMIMSQVLKAYSKRPVVSKRETSPVPTALKHKMQRLAAIDTPGASSWYGKNHPGGGTLKSTLTGIQENPLDSIDSKDPVRDPYDPDRQHFPSLEISFSFIVARHSYHSTDL